METDYLIHYGVLGMKWGVRKAKKQTEKAKKARQLSRQWHDIAKNDASRGKSARTIAKDKKRAAKKLADAKKHEAKAKKIESYHKSMAGTSTYNRVKNMSTGKTVAQTLLMGTYGSLKYNQARSKGTSRGKAAVNGLLYKSLNNVTAGVLSIAEPRLNKKKKTNS